MPTPITLIERELNPVGPRYAGAVRAGPWIFMTGLMAAKNAKAEIAPGAVGFPRPSIPLAEIEATKVFDQLASGLAAGKSSIGRVVRLDQYYTSPSSVDPYHAERRRRFGTYIPPSTSMIVRRLLGMESRMDVQAIAVAEDAPFDVVPLDHPDLRAHVTSGFSPAVVAGDLVFIPGLVASPKAGASGHRGMAPQAILGDGILWKGTPIRLETDYLIREKILPSLVLANASAAGVVKAQVYLTHLDDAPGFAQVWSSYFGKHAPALTIVPMPDPSIGIADARIEVNVIAVKDASLPKIERISDDAVPYDCQSAAVKVGDLLFLSGLLPIGMKPSSVAGLIGQDVQAQAKQILDNAARICAKAGTSLANVVRVQEFYADIRDFHAVQQVWEHELPNKARPFSAVETADHMLFPGFKLQMDLWVHVPQR